MNFHGYNIFMQSLANRIIIPAAVCLVSLGGLVPLVMAQEPCHARTWSSKKPQTQKDFDAAVNPLKKSDVLAMAIGESLKKEGSYSLAPVLWSYLAQHEIRPKIRNLFRYMQAADLIRMPALPRDPMIESDAEIAQNFWARPLTFTKDTKQSVGSLCAKFKEVFP